MSFRPVAYLPGATTGHLTWPPTIGATTVGTVRINGIAVSYNTASYITHVNNLGIPHPNPICIAVGTVLAYGQPIGRVGDFLSCGDTLANGSPNVLAGP